jgi:hypothetical protein
MPVDHRVGTVSRTNAEHLLERLLQEWRAQQAGRGEPLIIEESPRDGDRPNHLYVVWSEWGDLTPIERSRLILQAYEKYRGRDLAASVTLSMGLTPDEARRINIEF